MKYLALALIASLAACQNPTAPEPLDATKIVPSAQYAQWFTEVKTCSGLNGDMQHITFYTVPEQSLSNQAVGRTYFKDRAIYIDAFYQNSETVVKHEMMHALLDYPGHPKKYFDGVCGNLMEGD